MGRPLTKDFGVDRPPSPSLGLRPRAVGFEEAL